MNDGKRLFYTVAELSELIPLGRNSLYRLVGQEKFPKVTIGKKILIPVDGLKAYLADNLNGKIEL